MSNLLKVGTVLLVTREIYGHEFPIGSKVTILDVDYDTLSTRAPYLCASVKSNGEQWWLGQDEFEVVSNGSGYIDEIRNLQSDVYRGNVAAGWWEDLSTGEMYPKGNVMLILSKLALIHSEVSEALEGVRKNLMDDKLPHRKMIEVELADAVIRILDLCGHEGLDLAGAIHEKIEYNSSREDHKRENRLAEGGKKA